MSEWMHGVKGLVALIGSIVTVAGSAVGVLIAAGVIDVGGDEQAENQPPAIGTINLTNPRVGPGESTAASVLVTDPDRDSLEVRWVADAGTFPEGNAGSTVSYRAPDSGASVQITVEVSDGRNPPVSASQTFNLRLPTPVPTATPVRPPTIPAEPLASNPPQDFGFDPAPEVSTSGLDLTGTWTYGQGIVIFQPVAADLYSYVDYNAFDIPVGEGIAEIDEEFSQVYLEGTTYVDLSTYSIVLDIVDDFSMSGPVYNAFDIEVDFISLTR